MHSSSRLQGQGLRRVNSLEILDLEGRIAPSCLTPPPQISENAARVLDTVFANRTERGCPEVK